MVTRGLGAGHGPTLLPGLQHSLERLPDFKLCGSRATEGLRHRGVDAEIEAEIAGAAGPPSREGPADGPALETSCSLPHTCRPGAISARDEAVTPLILAPAISSGARTLLQQQGIAY